jgi:hypothetical protein
MCWDRSPRSPLSGCDSIFVSCGTESNALASLPVMVCLVLLSAEGEGEVLLVQFDVTHTREPRYLSHVECTWWNALETHNRIRPKNRRKTSMLVCSLPLQPRSGALESRKSGWRCTHNLSRFRRQRTSASVKSSVRLVWSESDGRVEWVVRRALPCPATSLSTWCMHLVHTWRMRTSTWSPNFACGSFEVLCAVCVRCAVCGVRCTMCDVRCAVCGVVLFVAWVICGCGFSLWAFSYHLIWRLARENCPSSRISVGPINMA